MIGSGHVMRTLTLSNALKRRGAKIRFICQEVSGNLEDTIQNKHHELALIGLRFDPEKSNEYGIFGRNITDIEKDAAETISRLYEDTDLLIVDHYDLDYRWHRLIKKHVGKLMVIDDLANRELDCDLVLDQTPKRLEKDYSSIVDSDTVKLLGSSYALIRSQFAEKRRDSISNKKNNKRINTILISMGGTDPKGITVKIIKELEKNYQSFKDVKINIVVTDGFPHITNIKKIIIKSKLSFRLLINVENMARLMLEADLAIGGGGTTSLERCVMALPSLVVVQASNQDYISNVLEKCNAIKIISDIKLLSDLVRNLQNNYELAVMSRASLSICDGVGAERVVENIQNRLCC